MTRGHGCTFKHAKDVLSGIRPRARPLRAQQGCMRRRLQHWTLHHSSLIISYRGSRYCRRSSPGDLKKVDFSWEVLQFPKFTIVKHMVLEMPLSKTHVLLIVFARNFNPSQLKYMTINENTWKQMEIHENTLKFMKIHENSWKFRENHIFFLKSPKICTLIS